MPCFQKFLLIDQLTQMSRDCDGTFGELAKEARMVTKKTYGSYRSSMTVLNVALLLVMVEGAFTLKQTALLCRWVLPKLLLVIRWTCSLQASLKNRPKVNSRLAKCIPDDSWALGVYMTNGTLFSVFPYESTFDQGTWKLQRSGDFWFKQQNHVFVRDLVFLCNGQLNYSQTVHFTD